MGRPFLLLLALCGCSDPAGAGADGGVADAGSDGAADVDAFVPTAPAPPALPALSPCPEGWRVVADDETAQGLSHCDPWPASGRAVCADDEAQFVGGTGCEVVGTPCGVGDWAVDLPENDDDIVYVKAGAVGGNGLRDTPYGDLERAIGIASARGATVALSKGVFDGHLTIEVPVTLWGACTAETILTRTERPEDYLTILEVVVNGASTIRNLTVSGPQIGIDVYDLRGMLVLDSVVIRAKNAGIFVRNAVVDATNLVIRDTLASDDGQSGYGVTLLEGAEVSISRAVLSGNRTSALSAYGEGTELVVRDTAVLDTLPEEASGHGGSAVEARQGAHATVERVAVESASSGGLVALEEGSVLDVTDATIRDVRPAQGVGGHGLVAADGGRLVGRRIAVARGAQIGVTVDGDGTSAELEDLVVTDTQVVGLTDGADGVGLGVSSGAVVTAHRLLLARNVDSSVGVVGPGALLVAEDVTVLDTAVGGGTSGTALSLALGGQAEITRFHAARSVGAAVVALGSLQLVDALLESTAEGPFLADGWGLGVGNAGVVDLERVILREHQGMGIAAFRGGRLTGRDVLVEDIHVAEEAAASGVVGVDEGIDELTRFVVRRAEVCGVQVALRGQVDLHDGEVRDNPIGANVQDPDFDLARIQDGVRYVDNGTSLDTSLLPVPDVGP